MVALLCLFPVASPLGLEDLFLQTISTDTDNMTRKTRVPPTASSTSAVVCEEKQLCFTLTLLGDDDINVQSVLIPRASNTNVLSQPLVCVTDTLNIL